jgi:hypothetical protein
MAIREVQPIFLKVFSIVIVVILLNFVYIIYKNGGITQPITGFSVKETIFSGYSSLSFTTRIFMISEWTFLFLILIYAVYWDKRMQIKKSDSIDLHIQRNVDKNKTDLDTLYETIKEKKEIPLSAISKSFNITKDIAMEWCKILESGELVSLSYPGFSEPLVRINEKVAKNMEIEKSDRANVNLDTKKEILESQKNPEKREETTTEPFQKPTTEPFQKSITESLPQERITNEPIQNEKISEEVNRQ